MDPLMDVYPIGDFKTEPNQDDEPVDIKEELLDEPIHAAHFEECFVSSLPEFYPIESELDPEPNEKHRSFVSLVSADHDLDFESENFAEYGDCLRNKSDPYKDRFVWERDLNVDGQTTATPMTETCRFENEDDEPVYPLVASVTSQHGFVAPKVSRIRTNGKKRAKKQARLVSVCEKLWVGEDGYQLLSEAEANKNTDTAGFVRKQDVLRLRSTLEPAQARRDESAINGDGSAIGGVPIAQSIDCQLVESMADCKGVGEMMALPLSETCQIENPDDESDDLLVSSSTPRPGFADAILAPELYCKMMKGNKKTKMQDQLVTDGKKIWVSGDFDQFCNKIRNNTKQLKEKRSVHLKRLLGKRLAERNAELAVDDGDLSTGSFTSENGGGALAQSNDISQPAQTMAEDEVDGLKMTSSFAESCQIERMDNEPAGSLVKTLPQQSGSKDVFLTPKQKEGKKTQGLPVTVSGKNFDKAVSLLAGWVAENEGRAAALSLATAGTGRPLERHELQGSAGSARSADGTEQDGNRSSSDPRDGVGIVEPADETGSEVECEGIEFEQQSTLEVRSSDSDSDSNRSKKKCRKIAFLPPAAKLPSPPRRDCLSCGSGDGGEGGCQDEFRRIIEDKCMCEKAEKPKTDRRKQMVEFRLEGPDDAAPPSKAKVPVVKCRSIYKVDQFGNRKVEKWAKLVDDNKASYFDDVSRLKRPKCEDTLAPKSKKPLIMCKPSCKDDKFDNQGPRLVSQPSSENNVVTVVEEDRLPAAEPTKANRRKQSIVCKPEPVCEPDETTSASKDEADVILFDDKVEAEVAQIDSDVMLTDVEDETSEMETDSGTEILHDDAEFFFACSVCYKTFESRSTLALHRRAHYSTRSFQCLECGATLCTELGLESHVCAPHAPGFECKRCRRGLPSEWSLVSHDCARGERTTRAACRVCGLNLTRRLLLRHMAETHPHVLAQWNVAVGDRNEGGVELSAAKDVQLVDLHSATLGDSG